MPRLSAGNPGTASKVDASGSSSMGDVHMWFRSGTATAAETGGNKFKEGSLKLANLATETTEVDVKALLQRYYSTVKTVKLAGDGAVCTGTGLVTFGNSAERDRALIELQGTTLCGARLSLTL